MFRLKKDFHSRHELEFPFVLPAADDSDFRQKVWNRLVVF